MDLSPGQRNCFSFLFILFLGLVYLSSSVHLWNDEHVFYRFSWTFIHLPKDQFLEIFNYSRQALHPPVYLIFIYFFSKIYSLITDPSVLALRLTSVIFTTFSFYLILKELSFKTRNLIPLVLITLFQIQTCYYWFDLGPYSLTFLLSTLYIIKLESVWRSKSTSKKDFTLLVIYIFLLSHIHYFGTMLIFCTGLVYIIKSLRNNSQFYFFTLSHALGFILFMPWFLIAIKKISTSDAPGSFLMLHKAQNYTYDFFKMMTSFSGNSLVLFFLTTFIIFAANKKRMNLLLSLILFFIITNIRSFIVFPLFVARYNFPILPIFFILFCLGLNEVAKTKRIILLYFLVFLIHVPHPQDYIDSMSARWLNPPYHLSLVDTYIKENPSTKSYSFYVGLNSHLDLQPYLNVIDISKLALYPIGSSCDLRSIDLPAIYLSNDLFCLPEIFIEDGFELLDDKYGSSLWVKR